MMTTGGLVACSSYLALVADPLVRKTVSPARSLPRTVIGPSNLRATEYLFAILIHHPSSVAAASFRKGDPAIGPSSSCARLCIRLAEANNPNAEGTIGQGHGQ